MRMIFSAILSATVAFSAFAADAKVNLTGENTKVEFTGTKPGGKHDGGFKKLTGTVSLTNGQVAKIEVTIDTDSLWSDNDGLTKHLKNADFFDVKTNPTSKFVSTAIAADGNAYKVTGDLTLNGKTKSITFPAKISTTGGFSLSADFKIDRTDFGMNYGQGKVDNTVALRIEVTAK